jgi:tetratricopeptide (TPR) repeat protein/cold shock CspA family protein
VNGIAELKQQASALRKQRKYEEALPLYQELWQEHRDQCDEWDGWGYAQSLRKLGRSQEALDVCRETYPLKPDFDYVRNLYAWCIYDLEIKRDDSEIQNNQGRFLEAADAILKLVEPGQYSPYARTLFRVIDYWRSRLSNPGERILEWCDRIPPDQLSNVPQYGPDGKGKTVEYASDREKWYSYRCRALYDAGRFEDCIRCAQEALSQFEKLHHDNDVWFKWRIALSRAELGDQETAISELKALLTRKRDWFIHHRIAQYYLDLGRTDEALEHAIEALLGPGPSDLGFKWELFLLTGRILQARSEMEDARKHVLLAAKVRQEQDWKIPSELTEAASEMDVDLATDVSARELHRELRPYWESLRVADMPEGQGEIKNMLSHGGAGFIRGDDGEDYYFNTKWFEGPAHLLEPGQRVAFQVEENSDPNKCDMAKFVKPL